MSSLLLTTHDMRRAVLDDAVRHNLDLDASPPSESGWRRRAKKLCRKHLAFLLPFVAGVTLLIAVSRPSIEAAPEWIGETATIASTATFDGRSQAETLTTPPPQELDRNVLGLRLRTVAIDAGHGGTHHGTELDSGLKEKDIALDIGLRLREILRRSGFEVVMTREDDRELDLQERAAWANDHDSDILISIHVNWMKEPQIRAIETFYLGLPDNAIDESLARRENEASGFTLADRQHLLDRIYDRLRQRDSRDLAHSVQASLMDFLSSLSPGIQDRGVKTAPMAVLAAADMPAILAEVGCLSNQEDASLLRRSSYRQYVAEALAAGISEYSRNLPGGSPGAS